MTLRYIFIKINCFANVICTVYQLSGLVMTPKGIICIIFYVECSTPCGFNAKETIFSCGNHDAIKFDLLKDKEPVAKKTLRRAG